MGWHSWQKDVQQASVKAVAAEQILTGRRISAFIDKEEASFMWSKQNKVWIHYRKDIIAADVMTAMFLSAYLRKMLYNKSYVSYIEVADLQRYKVLTGYKKVKIALCERMDTPFVFAYGKN